MKHKSPSLPPYVTDDLSSLAECNEEPISLSTACPRHEPDEYTWDAKHRKDQPA